SDTALVTAYAYNPAGWLSSVTDPRGLMSVTNYDNLGRTVQTIEAYTNGTPTANTNKTTNFTYDGDNNLLTYTAVEPGGQAPTTPAADPTYSPAMTPAATSSTRSNAPTTALTSSRPSINRIRVQST